MRSLRSSKSSERLAALEKASGSKRMGKRPRKTRAEALEAGLKRVSSQQSLASMRSGSDTESVRSERSSRSDLAYDSSYESESDGKVQVSQPKTVERKKSTEYEDSLASVRDIAKSWREEAKLIDSGDSEKIAPPKSKPKLTEFSDDGIISHDVLPHPATPDAPEIMEETKEPEELPRAFTPVAKDFVIKERPDLCHDPVLRALCNVY